MVAAVTISLEDVWGDDDPFSLEDEDAVTVSLEDVWGDDVPCSLEDEAAATCSLEDVWDAPAPCSLEDVCCFHSIQNVSFNRPICLMQLIHPAYGLALKTACVQEASLLSYPRVHRCHLNLAYLHIVAHQ